MCNSIHKQQKQQIVEEEKSCNIYNRRRVSHKSWNCSTIQRRRRRRAPHDPQQVHRYQPHVICLTVADFFFFFQKCKIKKKKNQKRKCERQRREPFGRHFVRTTSPFSPNNKKKTPTQFLALW